jgi:hypothetical protein
MTCDLPAVVAKSSSVDQQTGGRPNNAIRALTVIAESDPKAARAIRPDDFVEMLNSGIWTDRNKAGALLVMLTAARDRKLLEKLRARALDSLVEMARWHEYGHAVMARILLGRIAGVEESRLQQLAFAGDVDAIVDRLQDGATTRKRR